MSVITTIVDLPSELLLATLSPFGTKDLLRMTLVSRRFHAIILRIFYHRLVLTVSLKEHHLILECYHPSTKISEAHLFCIYKGTTVGPNGTIPRILDDDPIKQDIYAGVQEAAKLARLRSLYSRFRLELPAIEARIHRPYVRGGLQGGEEVFYSNRPGGAVTNRNPPADDMPSDGNEDPDGFLEDTVPPLRIIHLEEHEMFSQLVSMVALVRPAIRGFASLVTVKEGVARIKRDWLREQAESQKQRESGPHSRSSNAQDVDESRILWMDPDHTVGVRVSVWRRERDRVAPILTLSELSEEDMALNYQIDLEELLVRSTSMLLSVEKSTEEQRNYSGKAIVFGAYAAGSISPGSGVSMGLW